MPPSSPARHRRAPRRSLRRHLLAGVAALVGFLGAGLAMAPIAGAHHANLSATVACTQPPAANSYLVSYQASSWTNGAGGANSDVRVEYRLNGGAWQTGASFAFPNAPTTPTSSGSFEVSSGVEITALSVRIKAFANWGTGNTSSGPWATQSLTLPTGCVPPPVECDADEVAVDTDGNGIPDTCEPNPVECDADEVGVDTNGNGIDDACEPNPVECDADEVGVDTNGNGIDDACEPTDPEDPAPTTPREPTVLGQQVERGTGQPAPTSLPRTGADLGELSLLAIGLVLAGSLLTSGRARAARR